MEIGSVANLPPYQPDTSSEIQNQQIQKAQQVGVEDPKSASANDVYEDREKGMSGSLYTKSGGAQPIALQSSYTFNAVV